MIIVKQEYHYLDYHFHSIYTETDYRHVKLFLNVVKNFISDDYHDIGRLLLLMIIVNCKNWTISIIVKENIMVNRQKTAHPYTVAISIYLRPGIISVNKI